MAEINSMLEHRSAKAKSPHLDNSDTLSAKISVIRNFSDDHLSKNHPVFIKCPRAQAFARPVIRLHSQFDALWSYRLALMLYTGEFPYAMRRQ